MITPQVAVDMQLPLIVTASNFVWDGKSYERDALFPYLELGIEPHKVTNLLLSHHLMVRQKPVSSGDTGGGVLTAESIDAMSFKEVQKILKEKELNAKGNTGELKNRLKESLAN